MKCQIILFLILLSYCFAFQCKLKGDKCSCIDSEEYEFQCPSINNWTTLIHTQPESFLRLECKNLDRFHVNDLPDFRTGDVKLLFVRNCSLRNGDLLSTCEHFNMSHVKSLKLEDILPLPNTTQTHIEKDFFKGLESLEELAIARTNCSFDKDFLEYLPNLQQLYLEYSSFEDVNFRLNYSSKLKALHLSSDNIRQLEDNSFSYLTDLRQLHLWSNQLRFLTNASLSGLSQLTSLELSRNRLEILDEDVFSDLVNLVNISLLRNNLSNISANLFRHNLNLERIILGFNPRLLIPEGLFKNLTRLVDLRVESANLVSLPEDIFIDCKNLQELSLKNNSLEFVTKAMFASIKKLQTLNLSSNKLKLLPDIAVFSALGQLEYLNLANNNITEVTAVSFMGLDNLKELILSRNRITTFADYSFRSLVNLDLSLNRFVSDGVDSIFSEKLETLNLGYNNLTSFPSRLVALHLNLRSLDLCYNRISYIAVNELVHTSSPLRIDLSSNKISDVDFKSFGPIDQIDQTGANKSTIIMQGNMLDCTCNAYDLAQYNNGSLDAVANLVDLDLWRAKCAPTAELDEFPAIGLQPEYIKCPVEECPYNCSCYLRRHDSIVVINCSNQYLRTCPVLYRNHSRMEVWLSGNMIEEGPRATMGYDNVVHLDLSENRISKFEWAPHGIEVLNLEDNELTYLSVSAIKILEKAPHLATLTLSKNPWDCGCSAVDLHTFLNTNFKRVTIAPVICKEDDQPLLEKQEICTSPLILAVSIVVPVVLIFLVLVILYLRYKHYIKVWLFSKNLCMGLITEEEVDENKKYDVFISYSHQDEEFVIKKLLTVLESEPNAFKCCIHVRDFVPGDYIQAQIDRAILESRRTLVVLSNHFLASVWGKMEFLTAHLKAIKDNCSRVIILKYGELDEKKIDDDLKSYLKTNTYVEWGTSWFWKKLFYALPHKRYEESMRHANMMLKIDASFEFASSPISNPESTPPISASDVSKLDRNSLYFIPSESPLIINR